MQIFLKIVPVACLLLFSTGKDCSLMPNGHYKMMYTFHSNETDSRIEIENDRFNQYWEGGKSAKGAIKWVYDCTFELDYFNTPYREPTEFERRINRSFGDTCIEVKAQEGDTLFFRTTYSRNMRITINKGIIIKLN